MKTRIQTQLLRETAELGEEKAKARRAARLRRDPVLGLFLRKKNAGPRTAAKRPSAA